MAIELLDEHEQSERVRAWLRENALALVAGIVLGLGAIFGWKWWQQHEHGQRVAVGEQYDDVVASLQSGELEAARAEVAALEAAPYTTLASLRLAKAQVDAGDRDGAIETLRETRADDGSPEAWGYNETRIRRWIGAGAVDGPAAGRDHDEGSGAFHPRLVGIRGRRDAQASKTAIDSTCPVCGNIFTTPALLSRYPPSCTRMPASRARVAGLQDTYTSRRGRSSGVNAASARATVW